MKAILNVISHQPVGAVNVIPSSSSGLCAWLVAWAGGWNEGTKHQQ